jgi:predicted heme/steroid binding protein
MTAKIERRIKTGIGVFGLICLFCVGLNYRKPGFSSGRTFTSTELSLYNGDDPNLPVYLAMDGLVYDVSAGRSDFYNPDMPYHYLTGKDSSTELHFAGGGIIKVKYPVIGTLVSK